MFRYFLLFSFLIYENNGQVNCPGNRYNAQQQGDTSTCMIWGSYSVKTFDDAALNFRSECFFTAVSFKIGPQDFKIDIGGDNRKNCLRMKEGCFTFVKFLYKGVNYELSLDETHNPIIKIDGKVNMVPLERNRIRVHKPGDRVFVEFLDLGIVIKWDTKLVVEITVENDRGYETYGICGNKDTCSENDQMLTNKQVVRDLLQFLKAYQVDVQSCKVPINVKTPCVSAPKKLNARNACQRFQEKRFADAVRIVNPELYNEACIWNYCACTEGDTNKCLCDTFDSYAKASVNAGVEKVSWRTDNFCRKECSGDLQFFPCAPPGGQTCDNINPAVAAKQKCEEGCYCTRSTFLYGDKCYIEKDCPCSFGGKTYAAGESFLVQCNSCTCIKGKIECSKKDCYVKAMATGDPHYTTWDGKKFDFMGQCAYYLVKGKDFSIAADQFVYKHGKFVKDKSNAPSYMRRIIIKMLGQEIELKPNLVVTVNGADLKRLPYQNGQIVISKPSSYYVLVVLPNKVQVEWDGYSTAKVNLPTTMKGKIAGLFGTYTEDRSDDFLTPTGDIAPNAVEFGNSWKTEDSCPDAPPTRIEHPCVVNPGARGPAEKICSAIKSNIFKACQLEDMDIFYENCVYDACYCGDDPNRCACDIIASFADGCGQKQIVVNWRNKIPECRKPCPAGQIYQECGDQCSRSCEDIAMRPKCQTMCIEGCNCAPGTTLNEDGKCIPTDQCKCRKEGGLFRPGDKILEFDDVQTCQKGKWVTSKATNEDRKTIRSQEDLDQVCAAKDLSIYTACLPKVTLTCQNMHAYVIESVDVCSEGCQCKDGFVLDMVSESCLRPDECPCVHEGRSYEETSVTIQGECNRCTCSKGAWSCTTDVCNKCNSENTVIRKDCNTCDCHNGFWKCSKNTCECSASDVKHEGCKICTCENGFWKCNEDNCPNKCFNDNDIKREDCNTCTCINGYWQCTNKVCECVEATTKAEGCKRCICEYGTWVCNEDNCKLPVTTRRPILPTVTPIKPIQQRCDKENEVIVQEYGKCVCKNGAWKCIDGQCSLWGDSHVKTFDGMQYDFQGNCTYILATGRLNGDEFRITFLNERCSHAGATCLRSFTITANIKGVQEALTIEKHTILPNTKGLTNFILTDKILYITIKIPGSGIELFWDKNTWVYVKLDPRWQQNVEGLCGNYNRQKDDLETYDVRTSDDKVLAFVDLWRLNGECDMAKANTNACDDERAKWAQSQCNVLLSSVFRPCHDRVPVQKYYESCVLDSCKCDLGGDCECLCTAIAMYAQECNNFDVAIEWRTTKLCPMQCFGDTHYEACTSPCPPITCDAIRKNRSVECEELVCKEGCSPKKLPEGHVYTDDTHERNVPQAACLKSTCNVGGMTYYEGEITLKNDCLFCYCQDREDHCIDIPCSTSPNSTTTPRTEKGSNLITTTEKKLGTTTPRTEKGRDLITTTEKNSGYIDDRTAKTENPIIYRTTTEIPPLPCEKVTCKLLKCPPFAPAVKLDGQCCETCQHPTKCIVNMKSSNKIMLRKPGLVWDDGPCTQCTCVGEEKHNHCVQCKQKLCATVNGSNMTIDGIHYEFVKGRCCAAIEPVGCVHDNRFYRRGEQWNVDKCTVMKCVHDVSTNVTTKEVVREYCNEKCPPGFVYQGSQTSCCGQCIPSGCAFANKAKQPGEQWYSRNGCILYKCDNINGQYTVISHETICPEVKNCSGDIRKGRCCQYCSSSELFTWQNSPLQCNYM